MQIRPGVPPPTILSKEGIRGLWSVYVSLAQAPTHWHKISQKFVGGVWVAVVDVIEINAGSRISTGIKTAEAGRIKIAQKVGGVWSEFCAWYPL